MPAALIPVTVGFGCTYAVTSDQYAPASTSRDQTAAHHPSRLHADRRTTLGGADAANYSFAGFTSAANYAINPLALTVSGITSKYQGL